MSELPKNFISDAHSKSSFQLDAHDDKGMLSSATGFFFEINKRLYIITNWHVVSGKNSLTKLPISKSRPEPTHLIGNFSIFGEPLPDGRPTAGVLKHKIKIYNDDLSTPLWLEHPLFGSNCDVVALPVKGTVNSKILNNVANRVEDGRVPTGPGCIVFVIGFPFSLKIGPGLPLWKSGYIASEPTFDVTLGKQKLPAFFVDCQTRSGMSGSPVFANYIGMWDDENPITRLADILKQKQGNFGRGMQFIGCYSGRASVEEQDGAAIGLCWREQTLREVCLGNTIGQHPHVNAATRDD